MPKVGKNNKVMQEKVRINMDVEGTTKQRMDRLRDKLEATSYAEVVRRALILFERHVDKEKTC